MKNSQGILIFIILASVPELWRLLCLSFFVEVKLFQTLYFKIQLIQRIIIEVLIQIR
ncbi:MAG: hypothetical protein ACJA1N_001081 [Saprospiraceae bacterium]|jgi:hypothetical protein